MIMLVKSESFKEFEQMYNICYGMPYADHKKRELDRMGRRILKTKKELIDMLNMKGISTDRTLEFVDSVRAGYLTDNKFSYIKEFQYKNVPTNAVIDMVNDLWFERVDTVLELCLRSTGDISKKALEKLVFLTGLMSEVRIETYSIFNFSGVYDNWCKSNKVVVETCQFFTKLAYSYEQKFLTQISDALAHSEELEDEYARKKKEVRVLEMINRGKDSCENYGIDAEEFNFWRLFDAIIDLIDGQCEWFWSQD